MAAPLKQLSLLLFIICGHVLRPIYAQNQPSPQNRLANRHIQSAPDNRRALPSDVQNLGGAPFPANAKPEVRPFSIRTTNWQQDSKEPEIIPPGNNNPAEGTGMPAEMMPPMNGEKPSQEKKEPDGIIVPRGSFYTLRIPFSESGFNPDNYSVSQDRVITVTPSEVKGTVKVLGVNFGTVTLTFYGDNGQVLDYKVQVVPSLEGLKVVLAKRFPACNLELEQVANNIIMVTGTIDSPAEIEPITRLLENLVKPSGGTVINGLRVGGVMQVQLDVVVAFINRTRARALGFNFQQSSNQWYTGSQVGSVMDPPAINAVAKAPGGLLNAAGGATTTPLNADSTVFFGLASKQNQFFSYLRALEENRCFKVLANPSLVTLSGRPATFIVGGKQPYPRASSFGAPPAVEFAPFGTSLVFTPFVLGQGKIRLELRPEVSRLDRANSVTVAGSVVPSITSQEVHATVEMESGQVLVLGGLLETQSEAIVIKVPILGDLPLAGPLFRRVQQQDEERELLVMATPHLVSPLEAEQAPRCLPGDEVRSPTNCELFMKGMPEVPVGPCDTVQGARTQIASP